MTVVPRLVARMLGDGREFPPPATIWADTRVELPLEWGDRSWFDVVTGTTSATSGPLPSLELAILLANFPVAMLVSDVGEAVEQQVDGG
jgi:maltooligosyltrehalose synthase